MNNDNNINFKEKNKYLKLGHKKFSSLSGPRYSRSPEISKHVKLKKSSLKLVKKRSLKNKSKSNSGSLSKIIFSSKPTKTNKSRSNSPTEEFKKKFTFKNIFKLRKSDDNTNIVDIDNTNTNNDDLHYQAMSEMKRAMNRRVSEIDLLGNMCKDVIRKNPQHSLGNSVNHVWNVYDDKRNISGYYKSGRNGNKQSAYMETVVYDISVQCSVEKYFAATKIDKFSPRSQRNMEIKNVFQKSVRKTSLSDYTNNKPLELSFQKKIEGSELRYIKEERKISLFKAFAEHYPLLNNEMIKPIYMKKFISSTIISIVFGLWDGHPRNIILNNKGFSFFDNARSLVHSNKFNVWGDKIRLPYFTSFIEEEEFFIELKGDDIGTIIKILSKFLSGFKLFKYYLNSLACKKLIRNISKEWFNKELIINSFKERLDVLAKWVSVGDDIKTLDGLLCTVFPYYLFSTMLYLIDNIPTILGEDNHLLDEDKEVLWRSSLSNVGKMDDMIYLVNRCCEKNIDPYELFKDCKDCGNNNHIDIITKIISKNYYTKNIKENTKRVKLFLFDNCVFDFKECTNISSWVLSFLNQYSEIRGINIFDPDKSTLPADVIEKGFLKSVIGSLFKDGYFLTFYDSDNEVYCSICYINNNGTIKIDKFEILFGGTIEFLVGGNSLKSLEEFYNWLGQYKDRSVKNEEDIYDFVKQYSVYYKNDYMIKIIESFNITYIDIDKYELTDENVKQINEYEKDYLKSEGVFVYVYPENISEEKFILKYVIDDEIMKLSMDINDAGDVVTKNINGDDKSNTYSIEEFGLWLECFKIIYI